MRWKSFWRIILIYFKTCATSRSKQSCHNQTLYEKTEEIFCQNAAVNEKQKSFIKFEVSYNARTSKHRRKNSSKRIGFDFSYKARAIWKNRKNNSSKRCRFELSPLRAYFASSVEKAVRFQLWRRAVLRRRRSRENWEELTYLVSVYWSIMSSTGLDYPWLFSFKRAKIVDIVSD